MAVREGLLLLLVEQDRHGYELKTLFEQRTGELWQVNTGQIYTTLERLERDGLVEPTGEVAATDARRRAYRLTDTGRDQAMDWLEASTAADTPRDELVMKVLLVATGDDPSAALDTIDGHRHALLARLQEVRRRQRASGDDLGARLVADALAVRAEADLRWLDLCTERLHQAVRAAKAGRDGNGQSSSDPGNGQSGSNAGGDRDTDTDRDRRRVRKGQR